DAVAARLVREAISRTTVSAGGVAVVADLVELDRAVAAHRRATRAGAARAARDRRTRACGTVGLRGARRDVRRCRAPTRGTHVARLTTRGAADQRRIGQARRARERDEREPPHATAPRSPRGTYGTCARPSGRGCRGRSRP